MPEIVNQYTQTFIGQSTNTQWSFAMPMIPKLNQKNYFEIEVTQLGIERDGASAPHSLFFFVANIPGTNSATINSSGIIDSRVNLGVVANYDTGANPCYVTTPTPVTFRLNTLQPGTPFNVTMCRLAGQEISQTIAGISPPNQLVPASAPDVKAQFVAKIDNGAGGVGNTLTVTSVVAGVLAVGQSLSYSTGIARTITALGTGTGGIGTYTLSGATELLTPAELMTTNIVDSVSPCQFIMIWNMREMSPYEVRRNQVIQY